MITPEFSIALSSTKISPSSAPREPAASNLAGRRGHVRRRAALRQRGRRARGHDARRVAVAAHAGRGGGVVRRDRARGNGLRFHLVLRDLVVYNRNSTLAGGGVRMREQVIQQPTERLTLRIPAALIARVRQRASASRRSLNRYIVDVMEQQVSCPETTYDSHAEQVRALLEEDGLLTDSLDGEWRKLAAGAPLLTYDELWERLKGQRPLSADIIEMRGDL